MHRITQRFPSREALDAAPVSVGRLVARFALAGVVALALVIIYTAIASRNVGVDQAIADARRVTWVSAKGLIEPVVDPAVIAGDRAALDRLDAVIRRDVLGGSLARVKLWTREGRVAYADEPELIGAQFELEPDQLELFTSLPAPENVIDAGHPNAGPVANVSDLDKAENKFETETKLLEVYMLVHAQDGTPMLLEIYFRYSGVTEIGRDLWLEFAPVAIGALVALELIQIPFAWSMARRLRSGQHHRERLLRHAIDASEAERRRIAQDLHDGVVQDLTGVSLRLAAAARVPATVGAGAPDGAVGTLDPQLSEASATVRDAIRSLRSLLVDIYPPNLYEEGLASALTDLVGAVENRGLITHLDVDPATARMSPATMALLYRCAQETLRNVVAHSNATTVRVSVSRADDDVVLTVEDDGRGFSTDVATAQLADGHVGLKGLGDLVADAGGHMEVRSEVGSGTHVIVRVPRSAGGQS